MRTTKKIWFASVVLLVILAMGTTTLAASYSFIFSPPFVGAARWASATAVSGSTPYVDPSGTTNATTYALVLPAYHSNTTVSNYRTNVTGAKTTFTYKSGYGGSGQSYGMMGYPSNTDFQAYTAAGTWKP